MGLFHLCGPGLWYCACWLTGEAVSRPSFILSLTPVFTLQLDAIMAAVKGVYGVFPGCFYLIILYSDFQLYLKGSSAKNNIQVFAYLLKIVFFPQVSSNKYHLNWCLFFDKIF